MSGTRQFSTFTIDGLLFGIDVLQVQEVIRYQEMTRVPLSPAVVEGLINLRGQIVTAIDLRARLGIRPRDVDQLPMNVVVRTDEGAASLLVDEIGDVIDAEEADFEPIPETVEATVRALLAGTYKLKDQLLHVLDVKRTLELTPVAS